MSQSLVQIYVHVVFSTKQRRPFLRTAEERERLHAYLAGTCNARECPAIAVGGAEDHVHLLGRLGKTLDVSTLVRELKRESSKWIKREFTALTDFAWQEGYGAFSLSPAHLESAQRYVADQMEHHRKESFQDEFRRVCAKYGLVIDERFVWE